MIAISESLVLAAVGLGVFGVFAVIGILVSRASSSRTRDRLRGPDVRKKAPAPRPAPPVRRPTIPVEPLSSRVVKQLARLWPLGAGSQRHVQELLVHAGIREKGAVEIFTGAKLALALALPLATAAFMTWWTARRGLALEPRRLLMYCATALIAGMMLPQMWLRKKAQARIERVRLSLPDVLDILIVCVESGLGLDAALVRIGNEMADVAPELCDDLRLLNLEMAAGKPREECLRNLGLRTGCDEVEALVARINQAAKYGANLGQSLRIHAESLRQKRRQEAEERASKTTVKLLFPLVFFIFPTIFIVILGPAVIKMSQELLSH